MAPIINEETLVKVIDEHIKEDLNVLIDKIADEILEKHKVEIRKRVACVAMAVATNQYSFERL